MNTQYSFLQTVRKCLYTGAAMAFSSLTFMPLAVADDTDVFLGSTTDTSLSSKPNVLFILDTSGSMDFDVDINNPTGTSRLKIMKDALVQLMSSVNNVNVGLMTFNTAGGPVRYPVRYIDEPVAPETENKTTHSRISRR
jgi:type IV pilus assembly protein PilY1